MDTKLKLVTIICESVLEHLLERQLPKLGVQGYTISDARGMGHHGKRSGAWGKEGNIRIDVLCDDELSIKLIEYLENKYEKNYAFLVFSTDATLHKL